MSTRRYYLKMSDESVVNFDAPSAAKAMCTALETCIGRTILEYWSGDHARRLEFGFMEYEVPHHAALAEAPAKRKRKLPDNTVTMFDDAPRRPTTAGAHKDA